MEGGKGAYVGVTPLPPTYSAPLGTIIPLAAPAAAAAATFFPVAQVELKADLSVRQLVYYLQCRIHNIPLSENVKIHDEHLDRYDPQVLTDDYEPWEGKWYFFTPRDRKYRNGGRPDRAVCTGDINIGTWKATGKPVEVHDESGAVVATRRSLIFYRGKTKESKGENSGWAMTEYVLQRQNDSDPRKLSGTMRLDECVLCCIYKKKGWKPSGGINEEASQQQLATSSHLYQNVAATTPAYASMPVPSNPSQDITACIKLPIPSSILPPMCDVPTLQALAWPVHSNNNPPDQATDQQSGSNGGVDVDAVLRNCLKEFVERYGWANARDILEGKFGCHNYGVHFTADGGGRRLMRVKVPERVMDNMVVDAASSGVQMETGVDDYGKL